MHTRLSRVFHYWVLLIVFAIPATAGADGPQSAAFEDGSAGAVCDPGPAPCIEVDPDHLSAEVDLGQTEDLALTIGNAGTQTLNWTIDTVRSRTPRNELLQQGALLIPQPPLNRIVAADPETGDIVDENFITYGGSFGNTSTVVLHADGERLLVVGGSAAQSVIQAFDLEGNYLGIFAPAGGYDPDIMQNPSGIAIHPDSGHVLVTSSLGGNPNSVVEFDQEGNFVGLFIESGTDGISGPWSLHFRADDLLVSGTGATGGIYSFGHDGSFNAILNDQIGTQARQVVEMENGNILTVDFTTRAWEFDAGGGVIGNYTPANALRGIHELGNGNLLVSGQNGIREINRDNEVVSIKNTTNSFMISFVQVTDCTIPDWLQIDPLSGSVDPGDPPDAVTVTFDPDGLAPGEYEGNFCIASDDPARPLVQVPITLAVTLPADFATIEGTVTSQGYCGADQSPLAGAAVEVASDGDTLAILETDSDGFYRTFLPAGQSPIDIVATAAGHVPGEASGVSFGGGDVVVEDFDLPVDAPCATVAPAAFAETLNLGNVEDFELTIGNADGATTLNWDIATAESACADPSAVDWLNFDPDGGTTSPGDSSTVTVTVDTTAISEGVFEALICVTTNDDQAVLFEVPFHLTVLESDLGFLEGTVTSQGICGSEPAPLAGVTVFIEGVTGVGFEVTTDADGFYELVLSQDHSPLEITVGAGHHFDGTATGVVIEAGEITVQDFDLAGDAPCMELDPEAVAATVDFGQSQEQSLHIANVGTRVLDWAADTDEALRNGVLLVPQPSAADFRIVALDPKTGNVIDPEFITYDTTLGTLQHVVAHPDGERLLVSSQSQDVVHAFDLQGQHLDVFAPAGGANSTIMQNLRGMAFHPDSGNLLVAAGGAAHQSVVEFDLDGNFLGVFIAGGSGGIAGPWSILFRDTDVLVSASTSGNIYRYDHDGNFLSIWNDEINFPEQIVQLDNGNILAAAFDPPSGVWELDPNGNRLAIYGPLTELRGVHHLPGGNILVSDADGVHEIDRDNNLVETKITGNSRMIGFVQTIDCKVPDWLSVAPPSGSVEPGALADTLTLTFDTDGLAPGEYQGYFCVDSNDPVRPLVQVPVSLSVVLPADFATIEGTVRSQGYCNTHDVPIQGAVVEIGGAHNTQVLETDADGLFRAFLPNSESPLDLTVTAPDHLPDQAVDVTFGGGDTVILDFELLLDAPCATADPGLLAVALDPDQNLSEALTLGNTQGNAELSFSIETATPAGDHERVPPSALLDPVPGGSPSGSEQDLISVLGEPLPGLIPRNAPTGIVDCDHEPGIIVHDDGTIEQGYGATPGVVDQVRFVDYYVPATYPARFRALCVAFLSLGPTSLDFNIVFYADDGPDGRPGTLLGSLPRTATDIPVVTPPIIEFELAWSSHDISELDVTVTSGGLYIGVEFAPSNPNVFLAVDESMGNPIGFGGGWWWTDNTNQWEPTQSGSGFEDYRALFVRPVEDVIHCDDPETLSWLNATPASGVIAAGAAANVEVGIDTTGLAPGLYEAGLCIASNDPVNPMLIVPVELEVQVPDTFGTLRGTVASAGHCGTDPGTVKDTQITVVGATTTFTATTDENGFYSLEISADESPVEITASAAAYLDAMADGVKINAGETTTVDFDLVRETPCATVDPASLTSTQSLNTTTTQTLTIGNTGAAELVWSIDQAREAIVRLDMSGNTGVWAQEATFDERLFTLSGTSSGTVPAAVLAPPMAPSGGDTIALVLDDSTAEDSVGRSGGGQFLWLNRFTPATTDFPFTLDEVQVLFRTQDGVNIDEIIDIYIYEDADGNPANGADFVGSATGLAVQVLDGFSTYPVNIELHGPGDVLIAVVNRTAGTASGTSPAAVDQTTSQGRSWLGLAVGNPADPPVLPLPTFGVLDALFPPGAGNWMIRGTGTIIAPEGCDLPEEVPWLSMDPDAGMTAPGATSEVQVSFDATGLELGVHEALLCINSNDPTNARIAVPVTLEVLEPGPGVLMVEPSALDFGEVDLGEVAILEFSVFNVAGTGATNLVLTAIDGGAAAGFDIGGDCNVGDVLEPEAGCTVEVTFTPDALADFTGQVTIWADDQSAVVDLTGTGIESEPPVDEIFHDRFAQED